MSSEFFNRYFKTENQYPSDVAVNPIPWNEDWNYISSTFLNGFINYVYEGHLSSWVIHRYTQPNDTVSFISHKPYNEDLMGVFFGEKKITKKTLYERLISDGNFKYIYHTDISVFEDDVFLLCSLGTVDGKNAFIYFLFDCDVSDCRIGRFKTHDPVDEVKELFDDMVIYYENPSKEENPWPLPKEFFRGWVSF